MVQPQAASNPVDDALGASGPDTSQAAPPQGNPIDDALGGDTDTSQTTNPPVTEVPGSISGLTGKPNSMQAAPSEQTPEGNAAAIAQRETQHPVITGLGRSGESTVQGTTNLITNPMASGLLGAASNAYEHIKDIVPLFHAYEDARSSGKSVIDSLGQANAKAKEIGDAHDAVKQRIEEFKKSPTAATVHAVADAATLAASFYGGGEELEAPPGSPEAQAAGAAVKSEATARNLARVVNPQASEWPSFIKANADEAGNVVRFAQEHNRPMHTQLDYAKAARAAADETRGIYRDKILNPVGDDVVSVAGANYQGPRLGEGQDATLSAIDRRITKINNELRPGFIKTEQGKVMTAIANEAELEAERSALTHVLYKELALRTGVDPEAIAAIRQRFGKMYSIADQTEAAVNQRQSAVGRAAEGRRDVPVTATSAGVDIFNRAIRGGPEGIANRAFRKTLFDLGEVPTTELPEIKPQITPVRERAKLPTSSGTEIGVKETSSEEIAAQKAKIEKRAATVKAARETAAKEIQQNKASHGPRGEADATGTP